MKSLNSNLLNQFENLSYGFLYDYDQDKLISIIKENSLEKIVTIKQVHSDNIFHYNLSENDYHSFEGDSIITEQKNIGLGVYTADCVPVLIYEKTFGYISAVHAGWKGSLLEIALKAVNEINSKINSENSNYYAVIGPSIGKCCYEVGHDVASKFFSKFDFCDHFIRGVKNDKYMLDLVKLNTIQLEQAGIENIEVMENCTKCDENLPSYRREGKAAGRILSFIGMNQ